MALAFLPSVGVAQATKSAMTPPANPAYDAVVAGMSCKQHSSGRLDCEYKVGSALRFQITGVGQADAVVNFSHVDPQGDFTAGIAPLHGCVIVRPTQQRSDSTAGAAFVSPHDGKVYRNWNTCLKPTRR